MDSLGSSRGAGVGPIVSESELTIITRGGWVIITTSEEVGDLLLRRAGALERPTESTSIATEESNVVGSDSEGGRLGKIGFLVL